MVSPKESIKLKPDSPKKKNYSILPIANPTNSNNPQQITSIRQTITPNFGSLFKEIQFIPDELFTTIDYPWLKQKCFQLKKPKDPKHKNKGIIILTITNINNVSGLTLLISHDTLSTLGNMYPMLIDLSSNLHCNVVSYDYSGYGHSGGSPSHEQILHDIEHVASFLINNLGYQKKDLVLFGYSYGAEPTIHLISSSKYNGIAGVVLLSPYIVKISKSNDKTTLNEDIFLKCPFFVIHGKKDNIVPYITSTRLIEKIRNVYAWYPKSGEHFNILNVCRCKFYIKMQFYLTYIAKERYNRNDLIEEYVLKCNDMKYGQQIGSNMLVDFIDMYSPSPMKTSIRQSQLTIKDNCTVKSDNNVRTSMRSFFSGFSIRRSLEKIMFSDNGMDEFDDDDVFINKVSEFVIKDEMNNIQKESQDNDKKRNDVENIIKTSKIGN